MYFLDNELISTQTLGMQADVNQLNSYCIRVQLSRGRGIIIRSNLHIQFMLFGRLKSLLGVT